MNIDAERDGNPRWATVDDHRITPIGRVLRISHLDELPQLVNILRGDMSFVGPRPERPVFVTELASRIPCYRLRHMVKPGLTGWAQINYPYAATIEETRNKLAYDLYYLEHAGFFFDLFILARTARVVLLGRGAR
jgi:lipopolysaccharide/colanic/teichoic acid biosynthesis glycosyltransferase